MLEGRIAELLQAQASRFLRGFSADQLRLGLLSGRIELQRLALNSEPIDEILLGMEVPMTVKAGVLSSAVVQVSLMQGEAELIIDGLNLVLSPVCRWLSQEEVRTNKANDMQKLEFVHMRSQSQRRNMEHEMFHKLFSDYLSRVKVTIRNVHIRVEVDGCFDILTPKHGKEDMALGFCLGSCEICPVKGAVAPPDKGGNKDAHTLPSSDTLLLAETLEIKSLGIYHEAAGAARFVVPSTIFHSTAKHSLGVFSQIKQDEFVQRMVEISRVHMASSNTLMPPTQMSLSVNMRAKTQRVGSHVDTCLTMEIGVCVVGDHSRLSASSRMAEHLDWYLQRASNFGLWQFLHPLCPKPVNAKTRWKAVRTFVSLRRRVHKNKLNLREALAMRAHCKRYISLYKRKFNGPSSIITWRQSLPSLTEKEAEEMVCIELLYPPEKVVNFRMMAHAELRTEMALNKCMNAGYGGLNEGVSGLSRNARELTPLEQLHLHGQHGYGVNIFRGSPPPPSSIKIRLDCQIPYGIWWTFSLNGRDDGTAARKKTSADNNDCWALALDCTSQPVRIHLSDSLTDASVFLTVEVPGIERDDRPVAILLGRSLSAFSQGSPGRQSGGSGAIINGGSDRNEWCSIFELEGSVFYCMQIKTMLTSTSDSPWDIFTHVSCGDVLDTPKMRYGQRCAANFEIAKSTPAAFSLGSIPPDKSSTTESNARVRLRVPLCLASGQVGPCFGFLQQASTLKSKNGPLHSSVAWIVQCIRNSSLAVCRLHVRLPPVLIESVGGGNKGRALWPRFDAACHFEHGGLVDGFVVGLHNLRNFIVGNLLSPGSNTREPNSGMREPPLSLETLEQSMPIWLVVTAIAIACGVTLASHTETKQKEYGALDKALTAIMQKYRILNSLSEKQGPLNQLTLGLVSIAVAAGRRALWDNHETPDQGLAAMAQIHGFAAAVLRSLLLIGVPLHPRCLPLASWAGSREILEVISISSSSSSSGPFRPPSGLVIAAARGAFANPHRRQEEVVRWLLMQRAQINECDDDGRSLLEWASWSGAEGLVALALRAGLLPTSHVRQSNPGALALAVASRSDKVVTMLLRTACDPHVPARSGACGALLLAVQRGEYDLASQLMRDAPFVALDAALSAPGMEQNFAMEEDGPPKAHGATQATVVLIDSFRRFARTMTPRSGDDAMPMSQSGVRNLPSVPAHPDEGLYSPGKAALSGVQHSIILELPKPKHRVGHDARPQVPPHYWSQRSSEAPWRAAYQFVAHVIQSGFRPDEAVINQALTMLPNEAKRIVQHLALKTTGFDQIQAAPNYKELDLDTTPRPQGFERSPEYDASNFKLARGRAYSNSADDILPERILNTLENCYYDYGNVPPPHAEHHTEYDAMELGPPGLWSGLALTASIGRQDELQVSSLPLVRVVILGNPSVGKTSAAQCLRGAIGFTGCSFSQSPWLNLETGAWPSAQSPRLAVHVWDTSGAPLPGLLARIASEPSVALILLSVFDAEVSGASYVAESHVAACMEAASASSGSAPRCAMLVENIFSGSVSPPNATKCSKNGATYAIRGSLKAVEGQTNLQKAFVSACKDIADGLQGRQLPQSIGNGAPQDARKSSCLRGDATFWDPRSITWAWASVQASAGFLSEGALPGNVFEGSSFATSRCDGAVVSMDRLFSVFHSPQTASNQANQDAHSHIRALADVGLLCPIPCILTHSGKELAMPYPGCKWVLIPDFARRLSLTADKVAHMIVNSTAEKKGKQVEQRQDVLSARMAWDSIGCCAPSLRSALRDFLARGVFASGGSLTNARSMAIYDFCLLESGPAGDPSAVSRDDLAPGFFLIFDLVAATSLHSPKSERSVRGAAVKPPSSVTSSTPSGANQGDRKGQSGVRSDGSSVVHVPPHLNVPPHLTTVIVTASGAGTGAAKAPPFWDVYCAGPLAQWAFRSIVGTGACGPSFAGLRPANAKAPSETKWPLAAPSFMISSRATKVALPRLSSRELLSFAWMFNGPQGSGLRGEMFPAEEDTNPIAACCAALCGKSSSSTSVDFGGTDSSDSLAVCSDFEAAFISRTWKMAPRFLDEAMASGVDAWALCSVALARVVRDIAAAFVGDRARGLPLLLTDQVAGGARNAFLIPDGALPIMSGKGPHSLLQPFGQLCTSPGVDTWLRLCRPAALWSLAGGARGFQAANALQTAIVTGIHGIGSQVVEALQHALSVRLTEEHVIEVWNALAEPISKGVLSRRADGTWAAAADTSRLLL